MEIPKQTEVFDIALPVTVGDGIYRLTAPNPGPMTASGTNTYLIACGGKYMVVDPGPDIPEHIEAILQAVGGPEGIDKILVTHMHPDHSPAAKPLADASGAKVYGFHPVDDEYQDKTCIPDHIVSHDELIKGQAGGKAIRCLLTPGHVDNHVCYLLEGENILMTGDHIMQGSTVVIIPPHGNMKKYIASLQLLNDYEISALAPGHGEMIKTPYDEINGIVDHRLARESKVVAGLQQLTRSTIEELTVVVYDDVDPGLHPIAQLSLQAHLIKLEEDHRAVCEQEKWRLL